MYSQEKVLKSQRDVQRVALENFLAQTEQQAKEKSTVIHAYDLARKHLDGKKGPHEIRLSL